MVLRSLNTDTKFPQTVVLVGPLKLKQLPLVSLLITNIVLLHITFAFVLSTPSGGVLTAPPVLLILCGLILLTMPIMVFLVDVLKVVSVVHSTEQSMVHNHGLVTSGPRLVVLL